MDEERTECLIKHYKRLKEICEEHGPALVKAGDATGLDICAIDFLVTDKPYMLEVQSDFEIRLQGGRPDRKPFKRWYKRNRDRFEKEIPMFNRWMDKKGLSNSLYKVIAK